MYLMLQQETPEDFVIATGVTTTVRDFIRLAFLELGIELRFEGNGLEEKAYVVKSSQAEFVLHEGQCILEIDPRYFRPTEVELLIGDPSKAKEKLGWQPKHSLHDLVKDMIVKDLKAVRKEKFLKEGGF